MKRYIIVASAVLLAVAMLIGCDNDAPLSSHPDDGKVTVSGVVLAYRCAVGDWANNSSSHLRYTAVTGKQATVRFVGDDDHIVSIHTDDSSDYAVEVDPGTYTIFVECWHAWPTRFYDVAITKDTAINLEIVYDYLSTESILLRYYYEDLSDTLGTIGEMMYLQQINAAIGEPLIVNHSIRERWMMSDSGPLTVDYTTPVRNGVYLWQLQDRLNSEIGNPGGHPDILRAYTGSYICLG